jgi:uncharacterized membrane protein
MDSQKTTPQGVEMANLPDADLLAIMGPDFKRKMETSTQVTAVSTPAEHAASRARRATKLSDLRFSCAAVIITGLAMLSGALYAKIGFGSVQGLLGLGAIALGLVGMVLIYSKRAALLREVNEAAART